MPEINNIPQVQNMPEVRIKFSKTGQAKYIGHLDINRVFSRAFARTDIPLWFTEGFNPRPHMSFSLPLSLGVESMCENVDIRLVRDTTYKYIKDELNKVLPVGIQVVDVYGDFQQPENIKYSDYVYHIEFKDNKQGMERIKKVLDSDEIIALKKGKQGRKRVMKETNIKEFVVKYNISIRNDVVINVRLLAGIKQNLNPVLLFDTLIRLIDMDYEFKSISRISILDENLKEYC